MQSISNLLLDLDMELENYTSAIFKARNPSLPEADRVRLIEAGEKSWKRLEAAHRLLAMKALDTRVPT